MNIRSFWLLVFFILPASHASTVSRSITDGSITAADLPPAFSASYELQKNGLPVAETNYTFSKTQPSAVFKSDTRLTGMASWFSNEQVTETSQLVLQANSIQVRHYQYLQTGNDNLSINSLFDPASQKINTTINQQPPVITDYHPPVWDKLSMLIALMSSAARLDKKLQLQTLDKGLIKKYQLIQKGYQEIEIDEDQWIKAQVWQRQHKNKKTVFYLDPSAHFLPLKIEQYKRDKRRATLLLKEIQWQPATDKMTDDD